MKPTNVISVDNGLTGHTANTLPDEWLEDNRWNAIVNVMDDEVRELVHADFEPIGHTTEDRRRFLADYLARADSDLVIG
jgi:hypothetical protein